MRLADWLKKTGIRRREFAGRIGVSPSYVTYLCAGTVWPGHDIVARIIAETGGEVTADSFMRRERAVVRNEA